MKQSPFKFGDNVTGKHFTSRGKEIAILKENFSSLQNTVVIAPRGYGKSSLVREAVKRFVKKEKGYYFCFLDLRYVYSEEDFYNQYANSILKTVTNKDEEFLQLAHKFFQGARVHINTGTGESTLELGLSYIKEKNEAILNLPQAIAGLKNRKVIICVDEFQRISRIVHDKSFLGRLRSVWQSQDQVGYILYGSKTMVMAETFNKPSSPLYNFAETIFLKRINSRPMGEYVQQKFHTTGKEISVEICNSMIDAVENHPYYLQQLARNVWQISGNRVTESDLSEAIQALKSEAYQLYVELLDGLTNYQVSFLKALLAKETQLYSTGVINHYALGSSANVKRMLKALSDKGIINTSADEITFADPVFKLLASERLPTQHS